MPCKLRSDDTLVVAALKTNEGKLGKKQMKKLMIAAAIVCAAAFAQAGAVKWYWTANIQNGYLNTDNSKTTYDGKAAQPGTMYIFNALATDKTGATVDQQYVLTALLGGSDISALGAMDSYTTANGQMPSTKAQVIEDDWANFTPYRDGTGTDAGKRFADYFYAMVVDDNVYLSETYNAVIVQGQTDTSLYKNIATESTKNWGDTATFDKGGWYSVVPEPTSGLLLLIGVAGLALRRRRA